MYMFHVDKQSLLKDILLENLKILGVRCRVPKKIKENEKENLYYPEYQIFQKPLHLLKMRSVPRLNGTLIEVPEFLADACAVIERDIKTEGIFRRAGSTGKQRESKVLINQGKKVNSDYHVFDACSLVKLFFRELPQPLIPYIYQEIIFSCLLLSSPQKQIEALMLVCLLLPMENLRTLAFFMEVSKYSDSNKMSRKNLAIILTPTLMPAQKGRTSDHLDMTHHFKVLELLIEHSEMIGILPEHIAESLSNEKIKKKKRSGSLTRMFTGLKKMVGTKGFNTPDWNDSEISTPGSLNSTGKRKSSENNGGSSIIAKKKRFTNFLPDGALLATPLRCRMHGYITPILPSQESMVPHNLKKGNSDSPPVKSRRNNSRSIRDSITKTSGSNIVRRCTTKKEKTISSLGSSSSIGNLFSLGNYKMGLDRRTSIISWGRRKKFSDLFLNKSEPDYEEEEFSDCTMDISNDSELITVHKSEYEDIKNRVMALEEEIEVLNAVHSIQNEYEKTLAQSEEINRGSTEQLARRLSKELNIRSSAESKIIRSPSARKIGSIRRRSKESLQRSVEHKTSLRRGRPNTLQSGLPSPGNRRLMNSSESASWNLVHESLVAQKNIPEDSWQSGDQFFARDYLLQKLLPVPQGRPSIVEIRSQNAGMVLEKAKLFNALNNAEKEEAETKVQRRQSVRIENLRRKREIENKEKQLLTRTNSLGSDKSRELIQKKGSDLRTALRKNANNHLKNMGFESLTAFPQKKVTPPVVVAKMDGDKMESSKKPTPVIKKCLSARSPRHIVKTPINQMKTGGRSRATPIRALMDPYGTPRVGVRRSPRILARSLTSPPKLKD